MTLLLGTGVLAMILADAVVGTRLLLLGVAGARDGGAWYYLGFGARMGAFLPPAAYLRRVARCSSQRPSSHSA